MSSDVDTVKLAQRLRECAAYVERNEFHPQMYQVLADLHTYSGKHSEAGKLSKAGSASSALGASLSGLSKKLGKIALSGSEKEKRHGTSSKNAERVKQDLELQSSTSGEPDDSWASWWANSTETKAAPAKPGKPAFQRPTNPKSTLIANGWIEQQRRSKMRVVWKDVLASLVEGRKPGEETTLWIQREVNNATTGKPELEALHQVPIKWLKEVQYLDFYGDHRFNIKVYNVAEEFQFRCADADAAQNWVLTLQSIKEIDARKRKGEAATTLDDSRHSTTSAATAATVERKAPTAEPAAPAATAPPAAATAPAAASRAVSPPAEEQAKPRLTVKEMRAIAHGAGINTHGMERSDLERTVLKVQGLASSMKADSQHQQEIEAARRRLEAEHQEELRRKAEAAEKSESQQEDKRHEIEEEQRKRVAAARLRVEEEEKRRVAAEEQQRAAALVEERRRVEEQRRQQAIVEEQRRQAEARRVAEARRRQEEARLAHEAQQRYQQQQQQWQQQQAAQQQWQQQQAAAQQRAQAAQQAQWQQWQQQRAQQPQQAPPPPQQHPAQNGHQQQAQRPTPAADPSSTADLKYTKMAQETQEGSSEEKINRVKRNILTHWALQPPQLTHLRQIAELLAAIHTVFPPAFGVAGHDYFQKWTPVKREDLIPIGAGPDEDKLKKAVRKLRFFLHPDKLPRDLNEEQQFMCKMLWDISSDAWEEFKKRKEDLDWIKS